MPRDVVVRFHASCKAEIYKLEKKGCRTFAVDVAASLQDLKERLECGTSPDPPGFKPLSGDMEGIWEIRRKHKSRNLRVYYCITPSQDVLIVCVLLCDPHKNTDAIDKNDKVRIRDRCDEMLKEIAGQQGESTNEEQHHSRTIHEGNPDDGGKEGDVS